MLVAVVPRIRPVLCAALLALLIAAPAATPRVPAGWMGVVATDTALLGDAALFGSETKVMAANGVQSVRLPIYWFKAEPARGQFDFAGFDQLVASAAGNGLRVLPTVLGTPGWATGDGTSYATPPKNAGDFGTFMRALIGRYGPNGSFWSSHPSLPKVPIRQWQIWNEPELRQFWRPSNWAAGYVKLLRAARRAIRAADPGAKVVLAGLANDSWNYLRAIHEAGGAGLFDIAAIHAYTSPPSRVIRLLSADRRELDSHRGRRTGILVSEMGWSSGKGRATPQSYVTWNTTEKDQARRLAEVYATLASHRAKLKIVGAYWYSWYTPERTRSPHWEDYTGLRKRGAKGAIVSKPALKAYARAARRLSR